ncbi:MAG: AAA family ATPase [Candidatus Riflebacteria bacterium]|nr:AAA family ATPase [Candidatus Riflebacteria bacterium]
MLVVTGARQTGKTTLLKAEFPDVRYISLDAPENREALRAVTSSGWGRDVGPAILDEAQKLPVVFEKLKYAFDDGQVDFSILCGSSQILLLKKVRETLAGRVAVLELFPLMLSELVHSRDSFGGTPPLLERVLAADRPDRALARPRDGRVVWGSPTRERTLPLETRSTP